MYTALLQCKALYDTAAKLQLKPTVHDACAIALHVRWTIEDYTDSYVSAQDDGDDYKLIYFRR